MVRRSEGQCRLCGGSFAKAAMTRHLESCKRRKAEPGMSPVKQKARSPKRKIFHLVVEGHDSPEYWIHLEAPSDARLEDLDDFLRSIWLECCGHMRAFTIEETTYASSPMREFDERGMKATLGNVLRSGMKFHYEYDFGSTTELALRVVSEREGEMKGRSVELLARNEPPAITCSSCGKRATSVCAECIWSDGGWLCDECAAKHECGEEMLLPVVNSPRVGVCAYTG